MQARGVNQGEAVDSDRSLAYVLALAFNLDIFIP